MGSEFTAWVTRGMGLALGAGVAIGLIALAAAASGVLVLLFVAMMTLLTIVFLWLVEHARLQRYLLAYVATERRSGDQALDEDGRVQPDLTRGASAT